MIIGYEDLDFPVVAGQYEYNDILVDVGSSQISAWDSDPLIRFMLVHAYDNRYSMGQMVAGGTPSAGMLL
ncbi:hypothetical protein C7441_1094 [Pseudaminobacter salicylatoxidans]|uniref:Uncharacterized protein n=1 Tax=Pseudaminobacter salicylatoxidans TaxID=93369 RepID=A0A316C2D3_PSESE|nr:hypothetical protein C7441_1094 [Pseudaminobacter salicylatoxidans]